MALIVQPPQGCPALWAFSYTQAGFGEVGGSRRSQFSPHNNGGRSREGYSLPCPYGQYTPAQSVPDIGGYETGMPQDPWKYARVPGDPWRTSAESERVLVGASVPHNLGLSPEVRNMYRHIPFIIKKEKAPDRAHGRRSNSLAKKKSSSSHMSTRFSRSRCLSAWIICQLAIFINPFILM